MYSTLFVAGYGNSLDKHWQRLWFNETNNSYWVEQKDWNHPNKDEWIKELDNTINQINSPILIVAHSIGCHTVVEWVQKYYQNQNIIGALLVAPPDTKRKDFPKDIKGYSNPPLEKLPFKSTCIISSNDQYNSVENAEFLANKWGSKIVHVGNKGHINAESNLGFWEEGRKELNYLPLLNSLA
ncbi:RBBP9/YdeN family alpha/beta hydrolase [Sulfurospirillum sp. 1307]|jgi:predicted alpha/beta hydrolase family esterase